MRSFINIILFFCILIIVSCERGVFNELFGDDIKYDLPNDYKIVYSNNDTLLFQSDNVADYLIVDSIINGVFFQTTTGTCGKKPYDIFEFQYIYFRRYNNSIRDYIYDTLDDCGYTPDNNTHCISIVKGLVDTYTRDGVDLDSKINWYDSLITKVSEHYKYYERKKIKHYTFDKVYEFQLDSESEDIFDNPIVTWYYTNKLGFIGYIKKSGEIYELNK